MLSQSKIKILNALQQKKYRQKYHKFVVEGEKSVDELLKQNRLVCLELFATANYIEKNKKKLLETTVFEVTEAELKKISSLKTPNEALAVVALPNESLDFSFAEQKNCFYLDRLQDPGNVGTVLRIADWFGMPAVYVSKGTVDCFSPKVVQASMGAFLRIPIIEVLDGVLPDLPLCGAVMDGTPLFSLENKPQTGLIFLGNEGQGLSSDLEKKLTHRLTIPRGANGGAESLNAGVAAGIFAAYFCL